MAFYLATRLRVMALMLCMGLIAPAQSYAAAIADAQSEFTQGHFLDAASLARAVQTASGDALASRSTLVYAELLAPNTQRAALITQAEADARRAIARDGDNPEGHLYLAIALGFRARLEGRMAAHFMGLGKEANLHILLAQKLAPNDAWGHAVMGGWNLEICLRGGLLGRSIYHASTSRGVAEYERALELDPKNPAIIFQYAAQLLALNGASSEAKVAALLHRLDGVTPEDALGRLGIARTQKLALLLQQQNRAALARYIADQLDLKNEPLSAPASLD